MCRNKPLCFVVANVSLLILAFSLGCRGESENNCGVYLVDDALVVESEMELQGFDRKLSALIFHNKNYKMEWQLVRSDPEGKLLTESFSTEPFELTLHNEDDGVFTCFANGREQAWLFRHGLVRDAQDSKTLNLGKADMAWLESLDNYITVHQRRNGRRDEYDISIVSIHEGTFDKTGAITTRAGSSREGSPFVDARLHSCVSNKDMFFVSYFSNTVQVIDVKQISTGREFIAPLCMIDLNASVDGDFGPIEDFGADCGYLEADVLQDNLIVLVGSTFVQGKSKVIGTLTFFVLADLESGLVLGSRAFIERMPNKSERRLIRCVSGKDFGMKGFFLVHPESVCYYDYCNESIRLVATRSVPPITEFRYAAGGRAFFVREKDRATQVESVDLRQFLK